MTRLFFVPALLLAACSAQPDHRAEETPPSVVETVDLERYQGLWYEIARYPNRFEDKDEYTCVAVTARYALREDGRIDVTNTCRKDSVDGEVDVAEGVARVVSPGKLTVKFAPAWVPFASGDYWILDLTDEYSGALVGDPEGKYLWVLTRSHHPDPALVDRLVSTAADKGYATEPLLYPAQPTGSE